MLPSADSIPPFSICLQCGRCSSGCPVAFETAHTPRKVIRFLQLGLVEEACQSPFLWFCALCQACSVRCPKGVEVSEIMLALRRIGQDQGWVKPQPFYENFKKMIERKGRIRELMLGLTMALHRLPAHPMEEAFLLYRLYRKGKIR